MPDPQQLRLNIPKHIFTIHSNKKLVGLRTHFNSYLQVTVSRRIPADTHIYTAVIMECVTGTTPSHEGETPDLKSVMFLINNSKSLPTFIMTNFTFKVKACVIYTLFYKIHSY